MQCYRCKTNGNYSLHHIDGSGTSDTPNNSKSNLVVLCPSCHNYVQGFCDHCVKQQYCEIKKFGECWQFEDAVPPIHFKSKKEKILEESFSAKCPKCKSTKIKRISIWDVPIGSVYNNQPVYVAIYICKQCLAQFKRKLDGSERAWDNENIPIDIKDWKLSEQFK